MTSDNNEDKAARPGGARYARHSSLGLIGAVPLSDAVLTSPVVANGRLYVVDSAGVVLCLDARTLEVLWRRETRGGKENCNNVASPAVIDGYVHVGTSAGSYYVLDAATSAVVTTARAPLAGRDVPASVGKTSR